MRSALTLAAVLSAAPIPALAVLVDYGVAEGVSLRHCIAGDTACDAVDLDPIAIAFGGLPTETTAMASVAEAGIGSASGQVSLSGTIGAPVLKAQATGAASIRANTTAVALQSYTYTGDTAETRTFSATLTYSQSLSGVYPQFTGSGIYAAIDVFTLPVSKKSSC